MDFYSSKTVFSIILRVCKFLFMRNSCRFARKYCISYHSWRNAFWCNCECNASSKSLLEMPSLNWFPLANITVPSLPRFAPNSLSTTIINLRRTKYFSNYFKPSRIPRTQSSIASFVGILRFSRCIWRSFCCRAICKPLYWSRFIYPASTIIPFFYTLLDFWDWSCYWILSASDAPPVMKLPSDMEFWFSCYDCIISMLFFIVSSLCFFLLFFRLWFEIAIYGSLSYEISRPNSWSILLFFLFLRLSSAK